MPGYMIHLTEAKRIVEILTQEYRYHLSDRWIRRFYLGSLLPDTKRKLGKEGSHFWNPADRGRLALAPDPALFERALDHRVPDPAIMGYRAHLRLDHIYVHSFWNEIVEFLKADGTPGERMNEIVTARLKKDGSRIPVGEFFSSEYYYGDYTRMNGWITQRYGLEIPEYFPEEWRDFPLDVVDPKDLTEVLSELSELCRCRSEEGLRVFDRNRLMEFIELQAWAAAEEADAVFRTAGAEQRIRWGVWGCVDLHAHTCHSDGSLTASELMELAARKHLMAIAITDHDTVDGVREAMEAGERLGIEVIPGMEFSTMEEGRDVHMVGLFLDTAHPALREALDIAVENRRKRNAKMVRNLIGAGFSITEEDVAELGDGIWTRGNLAQLLVDKGYGTTVGEVMKRYLSPGTVGYEPKIVMSPVEAVRVVHEAGGLCFVAHFHQICRRDEAVSRRIAERILEAGADGLETEYCEYDDHLREVAEKLALKYGCLRSGGSDFHGKIKPGLELAEGYGELQVPEQFLLEMKAFLAHRHISVDNATCL